MRNRTRGDKIFDFCNVIFMLLVLLVALYPLYFTVIASLSSPYEVMRGNVILAPKGFTIDAYRNVFMNDDIWIGYRNSTFYTIAGTLYALCLTIPCGYVLSRKELPGKNLFMVYFMITMYFSGGMIPSYLLVKELKLLNTPWALILGGMSVYNMIITHTFYKNSIPDELYEAAKIDGANEYRTFFQVALPLSKSIIAVIALYVMVGIWNSYFNALLYVTNQDLYPLQLILRNILLLNEQMKLIDVSAMDEDMIADANKRALMAEGMKYSLIFISSLPMLIAYPFVQKHFVKGVMIGAVKG